MSIQHFALLVAVTAAPLTAKADEPNSREAIQRSLVYLDGAADSWIAERKCVSCHQVPAILWTLNDARSHGYELDSARLDKTFDFALKFCVDSKTKDDKPNGHGMSTVAQMLLARDRGADTHDSRKEQLNALADLVVTLQDESGFWTPGGQPQRRPVPESNQVTTLWMTLAIQTLEHSKPELLAARDRAIKWLGEAQPKQGQSTEWWVARYLAAREFNQPQEARRLLAGLLKRQHEDGGWGWLTADSSDAFGTGLALYALHDAGRTVDDPVVRRARQFLLATQRDDGSWASPSTHKKVAGKENKLDPPTGVPWGSAWAVIGLLHTQPAAEVAAK